MAVVALFLQNIVLIYTWAIIIYILMSWFPGARESSFGQLLAGITEPYLEIFRRIIPPLGGLDLSPIIAIFALRLALGGLIQVFRMVGLL
ncbi:MAG TPA: YggT family protein [Pseudogracilibacillus sp.]|nr:YggT family protein [Pseudogracilibacillus sp.]